MIAPAQSLARAKPLFYQNHTGCKAGFSPNRIDTKTNCLRVCAIARVLTFVPHQRGRAANRVAKNTTSPAAKNARPSVTTRFHGGS